LGVCFLIQNNLNKSLFLLQTGRGVLIPNGEVEIPVSTRALSKTKFMDDEILKCIKKSEHVAKWFDGAEKVETVYI